MASAKSSEFGVGLRRLREKAKKSRYRLAQFSGLDEAYLSRLESGERRNPSRDTVMKLGLALVEDSSEVSIYDINELLLSAGYAPLLGRGETILLSSCRQS